MGGKASRSEDRIQCLNDQIQQQLRRLDEREKKIQKEKDELQRKLQKTESALVFYDSCRYRTGQQSWPKTSTIGDSGRTMQPWIFQLKTLADMGWNKFEFNVAITGPRGAGKSTFINEYCGFTEGDLRAGQTETTVKMTKFKPNHTLIPKLALWELPAAGAGAHPIETYFYDNYLHMFNVLVIMFEERFPEDYLELDRKAVAFDVPVILVRTKADEALRSRKRIAEHKGKNKAGIIRELIHEFRQNTEADLAKLWTYIDPTAMFLVNAWALSDDDEPRFQEADFLTCLILLALKLQILRSETVFDLLLPTVPL